MLPMGTIVTVIMLIGLIGATTALVNSRQSASTDAVVARNPGWWRMPVGFLVLIGGAWNTFWYALRNVPEFWGNAALLSGIAMMLTGLFLLAPEKLPAGVTRIMPLVLVILLACMLLYGITIYRL